MRNQNINRGFRQKYPVGNAENRISTGGARLKCPVGNVRNQNINREFRQKCPVGNAENRISTGSLDKNTLLERGKFEYQQEVKTLRMPLFLYA
ncbi:hypothetical protein [Butyrivibrio sp. LB2008]|uniref:hypothetical protein n=1 Tax=Butyrivibrio sp. LB2008 TaxID=1408305 RepID=UPI000479F8C1|nr:hypothetical protein [Butyrivibrio sp. LB2008]